MKKIVFKGAGVAVVTPMFEDFSINYDKLGMLIDDQIANGTAETTFEPEASVTREQLATFLYRYAASSSSEALPEGALPDFPDKGSVTDYAIAPFAWACGEGLINGVKEESNTYLRPQSSATRAQVATILMRYIEKNL